jgi:hypothetical protein
MRSLAHLAATALKRACPIPQLAFCQSESLVTSIAIYNAFPPADSMVAAVSRPRSSSLSKTTTKATLASKKKGFFSPHA